MRGDLTKPFYVVSGRNGEAFRLHLEWSATSWELILYAPAPTISTFAADGYKTFMRIARQMETLMEAADWVQRNTPYLQDVIQHQPLEVFVRY